jgi:hypothetical protein
MNFRVTEVRIAFWRDRSLLGLKHFCLKEVCVNKANFLQAKMRCKLRQAKIHIVIKIRVNGSVPSLEQPARRQEVYITRLRFLISYSGMLRVLFTALLRRRYLFSSTAITAR